MFFKLGFSIVLAFALKKRSVIAVKRVSIQLSAFVVCLNVLYYLLRQLFGISLFYDMTFLGLFWCVR